MTSGETEFSPDEIATIRRLLREKGVADRDRQKSIRRRRRSMGFRISDFARGPGFVESDLDDLIRRGVIVVIEAGERSPSVPPIAPSSKRPRADVDSTIPDPSADDELEGLVEDALRALRTTSSSPDAEGTVPSRPGLYAIYGGPEAWADLGLGNPPDDRPLYVGKAEDSLASRDLKTHFGSGRTGSSTVRRSFAALLHDSLSLEARPRNPERSERFANYASPPKTTSG
jgi:hypothetical protein